jgi:hypothetical protein
MAHDVSVEIANPSALDVSNIQPPIVILALPKLVELTSPDRYVFNPLLDYTLETRRRHPDR